jgi:hypothetical protein
MSFDWRYGIGTVVALWLVAAACSGLFMFYAPRPERLEAIQGASAALDSEEWLWVPATLRPNRSARAELSQRRQLPPFKNRVQMHPPYAAN